jgi:hypothetical protein
MLSSSLSWGTRFPTEDSYDFPQSLYITSIRLWCSHFRSFPIRRYTDGAANWDAKKKSIVIHLFLRLGFDILAVVTIPISVHALTNISAVIHHLTHGGKGRLTGA